MRWQRTSLVVAGVVSGHVGTFSYVGAPAHAKPLAIRVTAVGVCRTAAPGSVSFVLPGESFRWEAQSAGGVGQMLGFGDGVPCECDEGPSGTLDWYGPTWAEPGAVAEVVFTVDVGFEP